MAGLHGRLAFRHEVWSNDAAPLCRSVADLSERRLQGYRTLPGDIAEHAAIEQSIVDGGYGHRQIFELIQNAADAIRDASVSGRIEVRLTGGRLYCANEGSPLHEVGASSILQSHVSAKRKHEIGHFGLGFKSVLGISTRIGVYSRSGSFEFDTADARQRILEAVPEHNGPTPGLRLAKPVDPMAVAAEDERLRDLMAWATTVIRVSCDRPRAADLASDLAKFPAEFLLFSPHVSELRLRDDESGVDRVISLTAGAGDELLLRDGGGNPVRWRVFRRDHEMSAAAKADAGEATARDQVEVAWAAPLDRRRTTGPSGEYWAFFPTTYESSLTGILNAPWKTNSDRQGLLEGLYNREIIESAARLIAGSLAALYNEADPGAHLDLLPRLEEPGNWANQHLTAQVYEQTANQAVLPDSDGRLCQPRALNLLPQAAGEAALAVWKTLPSRPARWAHDRTTTPQRRARANKLGAVDSTIDRWLNAIAAPATADASIAAIRAAAGCEPERQRSWQTELPGQRALIVLTSDGALVQPLETAVFLHGSSHAPAASMALVHPDVQADPEARRILEERFRIRFVDPMLELETLIERAKQPRFNEWEALWAAVRRLDLKDASKLLRERRGTFCVRTVSGAWVRPWEALLPGSIVPDDGSRDGAVAVDMAFHHDDEGALNELGVAEKPGRSGLDQPEFNGRVYENWQYRYLNECRTQFQNQSLHASGSQPQWGSISEQFERRAGPISPFWRLSEVGEDAFILALLPLAASDGSLVWSHKTRRNMYADLNADSPAQWLIRRHAALPTSLGRRSSQETVGRGLAAWAALLPVIEVECSFLGLPSELAKLPPEAVAAAYERALRSDEPGLVTAFYAEMALAGQPCPDQLRVAGISTKIAAPAAVLVAHEPDVVQLLPAGQAVLLAANPEHAEALVARWGLQRAVTEETFEYEAAGPAAPLVDVYPGLPREVLGSYGAFELVPCESVWRERNVDGAKARTEVPSHLFEVARTFAYQVRLEAAEILRAFLSSLRIDLPNLGVERAVRRTLDEQEQKRVAEIRGLASVELKLSALLGSDRLRAMLSDVLGRDASLAESALTGEQLAAMVLAIHGSAILERSKGALEVAGFSPPHRWAGGDAAMRFVRSFGFPDSFAGAPKRERPPFIEVDGPMSLPPLHDFQETIAAKIRAFLTSPEPGRGLLSLPTGAGKTRVATESLTRAYKEGDLNGVVLWLADREELCEQAVQSWKEVWSAFGPPAPLRISRLWGQTNSSVEDVHEKHHVVVATFQSLRSRLGGVNFTWLTEASCVVIDEAHGSVTPSYTGILRELDLTPRSTARPLIGLTATPFRGQAAGDGSETSRLVNRYAGNRFDHGVFDEDDPYPLLHQMDVLSDAEFEVLEGIDFELSEGELKDLRIFDSLPSTVEARLGLDEGRNARIVDRITKLPRNWPTLVFAASMPHAELLAALLAKEGLAARAISSRTDQFARRNAIAQFKAGEIQVLTNYKVLTTGFDAPKTRALFVTRPIYSPGLYMQVVGRGLRGPANGGTPSCLLVNVADNLLQYGNELAFRQFEHLWQRVRGDFY